MNSPRRVTASARATSLAAEVVPALCGLLDHPDPAHCLVAGTGLTLARFNLQWLTQ